MEPEAKAGYVIPELTLLEIIDVLIINRNPCIAYATEPLDMANQVILKQRAGIDGALCLLNEKLPDHLKDKIKEGMENRNGHITI